VCPVCSMTTLLCLLKSQRGRRRMLLGDKVLNYNCFLCTLNTSEEWPATFYSCETRRQWYGSFMTFIWPAPIQKLGNWKGKYDGKSLTIPVRFSCTYLTLGSIIVTKFAIWFSIKKLCLLSTQCIYVFSTSMIPTTGSDYFPEQHSPVAGL
jgi:hypothetical protein